MIWCDINAILHLTLNISILKSVQSNKSTKLKLVPLDQEQLQHAFAAFNEASEQLSGVYQELQYKVDQLTRELALANGELHRQLGEKEDLSQRLSLLLNALPGGVIALDSQECIEQINPAAILILGNSLLGLSWQRIIAERLLPTTIANEWNLQQVGMSCQRRIRVESSPADSAGRRILLVNDITEAYANQEQVKRNQRLTSMGEMAANLAHQLRTPLSTALLYASHLGNNVLNPDERQKFATKTIERLHHLEHLTKDMLRFVKGETAQLEYVFLQTLLADLRLVIEPQMVRLGLKFTIDDNSEGLTLYTDHKALCGALTNLLENAIQVSSAGDHISLTCDLIEDDVILTVADNGPGIDTDIQERLFEPFFTTRSEGTGLGLAIVRGIIQAMGGSVQVNSIPNIGSEFIIRLPSIPST